MQTYLEIHDSFTVNKKKHSSIEIHMRMQQIETDSIWIVFSSNEEKTQMKEQITGAIANIERQT